jgi:hypothetical protein
VPVTAHPLIIESIVTTVSADDVVNVAPMGVEWGDDTIVLKPFVETATYRNLVTSGEAVVNITDDVRLFARAAIANPQPPTVPAAVVRGVVLEDVCSWREVRIEDFDRTPPRARAVARVLHRGSRREFIGFNRARHAVLEAAIYATRLHLLPRDTIRQEFDRLQIIVDKTAGAVEREAMALLTDFVRSTPRAEPPAREAGSA